MAPLLSRRADVNCTPPTAPDAGTFNHESGAAETIPCGAAGRGATAPA